MPTEKFGPIMPMGKSKIHLSIVSICSQVALSKLSRVKSIFVLNISFKRKNKKITNVKSKTISDIKLEIDWILVELEIIV